MSLLGQLKPVAIKLKITQCDKLHIFTPRCSNTFQIWTFLWNYLYISHLKEIYPMSLLGQLKPVAIKWKLLNAINYTYSLRVVQIHFKFEHFFEIISILAISKKYLRCRCSDNLNQLRSSWKLLNTIDDPYLVHVDTKHFEFGHFIASITIIVISLKIY